MGLKALSGWAQAIGLQLGCVRWAWVSQGQWVNILKKPDVRVRVEFGSNRLEVVSRDWTLDNELRLIETGFKQLLDQITKRTQNVNTIG